MKQTMISFYAREKYNDVLRSLIDKFIAGCAIVFRVILFFRIKTFSHRQAWLRRKYGITDSTPIHPYDDFTRFSIETKFKQLGSSAIYAYTSGSTREPKKIAYDQKRLRKTRLVFVDAFFRYLASFSAHRTLFIFSSIQPDQSLTTLLLKEEKLPPYLSGLQAPHRLQNHPDIHKAVRTYGETAVRFFLIAASNPVVLYATNPSTIAIFLHELYENWSASRRLIVDYIRHREDFQILRKLHNRVASIDSQKRLEKIANAFEPLSVDELFPALSAVSCWDGGYVRSFLEQIRKYLPESRYKLFPMYSMSTEIIETIAGSIENPVFLPLAPGVYYEFIEEGKEDLPKNILRPHELVVGRLYAMVVTDAYGLHRYQTEDLFQCAGIVSGVPDLRFVRRRNLSYSFTGEKLTSDQLKLAYQDAENSFPGLRLHGFLTCFPSRSEFEKLPCYRLLLVQTSSKAFCDGSAVASMVENKLGILNEEFKAKIESRRLGRMIFETVPIRDFVGRVSNPNDSTTVGSQFKFLPLYLKLWEELG